MELKLLLIIIFLLKGNSNETQQTVVQHFQTHVLQNCIPNASQEHRWEQHCYAWRNPPVSDAVLFPADGLQKPNDNR